MFDIVSMGSATRDVFLNAVDFKTIDVAQFSTGKGLCFSLGSKIEIKKIVFTSGGGGTNAAVTFARQGLSVACVGVIGKDLNGQEVLNELLKEGVEIKHFQKHDDNSTAYSVILVDSSGE